MILYCIFWVLSFKHIHLNSVNNIGYGKITTFQYQIICYAYKNKHIISPRVKSLIQVNISNMGYLMINGGFEISEVVFQFQFRKARMFLYIGYFHDILDRIFLLFMNEYITLHDGDCLCCLYLWNASKCLWKQLDYKLLGF